MHSGNNVLYAFIDNRDKKEKVIPTLNLYVVVHVHTKFKKPCTFALIHIVYIYCECNSKIVASFFLSKMPAHLDTPSCYGYKLYEPMHKIIHHILSVPDQ